MEQEQNKSRTAALAIIQSQPESERALILTWAKQMVAIRERRQPRSKKLAQMLLVTQKLGLTKSLLRRFLGELHRLGWKERGKAMRGLIGGFGIGILVSVSAPMAGLAAFGGAIAVPVFLLSAGAGAILGAIVDELEQKKNTPENTISDRTD